MAWLRVLVISAVAARVACAAFPCDTVQDCLATDMWHIPGPNPIVSPWNPNGKESWMSEEVRSGDL